MTSYQKVKIPNFDNKPVKFKNKVKYPQPPESSTLPNNFFTCLIIGSTGTGKTYACCKLLKYYEQYKIFNDEGEVVPQRIFLLSPSIASNPIFTSLKNLDEEDCYTNYSDNQLQVVLDDIAETKREAEQYQEDLKIYKKFLKTRSLKNLTPTELLTLDESNFEPPVPPRYKIPPINNIILDDLLNSPAFKSTGKSLINSLAVRNRHLGINLYILGQSANQIPKVVRSQARLLMLYRYNSKNIITDLYEIVSSVLTPEEFEKIYMENTEGRYSFLTIDNTHKEITFKQNLDTLIVLNKKGAKEKEKEKSKDK